MLEEEETRVCKRARKTNNSSEKKEEMTKTDNLLYVLLKEGWVREDVMTILYLIRFPLGVVRKAYLSELEVIQLLDPYLQSQLLATLTDELASRKPVQQ